MTALESLNVHLRIKKYEYPNEGSSYLAELYAISAELQNIYDIICSIKIEMFLQTASDEGLYYYAELYGLGEGAFSDDQIRSMCLARSSINDRNGRISLWEDLGDLFCISGRLTENGKTVKYETSSVLDEDNINHIESQMSMLMPLNTDFALSTLPA